MAQSSVVGAKSKNGNGHAHTKSKRSNKTQTGGVKVTRHFTQPGVDPLEAGAPGENGMPLVYERRSSVITNPDGSIVFKMEGAEIPSAWSQLATDIVVSKYFRKAGLHGDEKQGETQRPPGRLPHRAHDPRGRREASAATSRRRATPTRSRPSSRFLLVNQYGAFNSPVWFNCGLCHALRHRGLGRQLGLGPETTDDDRRDDERLRAPAVLGVLHPGGRRRPHEHLRARQERGAPLQVRLGHRHRTSARSAASRRSSPAAARRAAS